MEENPRKLSIIAPCYNEEENIEPFYTELCSVLPKLNMPIELVFVDDGSTDDTPTLLRSLAEQDERVVFVKLRRNFGQTAALAAGLDAASGSIVAFLDADLQNDPQDLPMMLEKLDEGYDLVAGWRKKREDPFLSRRLPSQVANLIISSVTDVKLHDYGCTLKVAKAEVAKGIKLYGEMHRFIPALVAELGGKITEVPVNHRARTRGSSKYGLSRIPRVLLDLLTVKFFMGFATRPIHMFGGIGVSVGGIGGAILAYLAFVRLVIGNDIGGRPLLLLAFMLFLTGLQLVLFGLLAEILTRSYHEGAGKQTYVIADQE